VQPTAAVFQDLFEKQERIEARSARRNVNVQDLQRLAVDWRPDVDLLAVDFDFRLVDGDLIVILAVRPEQMLQSVKPLPDRFVRPVDERFDPPVR
jgi:hypothetical protein